MNSDGLRIASYYDRLVDTYGHDPRACDAASADSLVARHEVLLEAFDLAGRSVLEVGCGFGDLGRRLVDRHPEARYTGVDVSSRMIAKGREIHPDLDLRECDVLDLPPSADWDIVLAQGVFYLLKEDPAAKTARLIDHMFALAREGVALTCISTWVTNRDESEHRVDPLWLLEHCARLTRRLTLRHDYHPGDVAIHLYKRTR